MHSRVSGLSDHLAADELDAIRIGRRIVARSTGASSARRRRRRRPAGPRRGDLLGLVPADLKTPFDPREVIARIVDGSEFDEFKPLYGTSLVTGWARLHGYPLGILANARGVLFSEESQKATQFIQLANQRRHAAAVPPEHHRLHGRQGVRAGRDHQARGDDDQRRHQLDGAAPHRHARRLLRRRQLRHVRAGLRAALPVHLAERQVGGDGAAAARRGAVDRRPAGRRGRGQDYDEDADAAMRRRRRGPDRARVGRPGDVRAALRRRDHHRPARHPQCSASPLSAAHSAPVTGRRALRGLPAT